MTREEIRRRDNVYPAFLAEAAWLDGTAEVGGTWGWSAAGGGADVACA